MQHAKIHFLCEGKKNNGSMLVYLCSQGIKVTKKDQNSLFWSF